MKSWVSCYELVKFLNLNRCEAVKVEGTKEWKRLYGHQGTRLVLVAACHTVPGRTWWQNPRQSPQTESQAGPRDRIPGRTPRQTPRAGSQAGIIGSFPPKGASSFSYPPHPRLSFSPTTATPPFF